MDEKVTPQLEIDPFLELYNPDSPGYKAIQDNVINHIKQIQSDKKLSATQYAKNIDVPSRIILGLTTGVIGLKDLTIEQAAKILKDVGYNLKIK